MKTSLPRPSRIPLALAAVVSALGIRAQSATAADDAVKMPTYEVTAPKFTSPVMEFYEKFDNLSDDSWVDAQGGELIQAIIWRYGYLRVHPSDSAVIYVNRNPGGRVLAATTVYTLNGNLYASSYALGERQRLGSLTAADINNPAKIEHEIDGIREQYQIGADLMMAVYRGGGFGGGRGGVIRGFPSGVTGYAAFPSMGSLLAAGSPENFDDTGQIVPSNANIFYGGGGIRSSSGSPAQSYYYYASLGDHFHESPSEMLDTVYRALSNPNQAGMVPVAIGSVASRIPTAGGSKIEPRPAIVFDWDGVHYVYRPYVGTLGHPIQKNPVTGLPYLCVRDGSLIESVYFAATYLKSHPGEKAVVVAGGETSAAYTAKGKLCLFIPSLNHFALVGGANPAAIDDPKALDSSIARVKANLAALLVPATTNGRPRARHLPTGLAGDTADLQMRRIYVAFQSAGIPVYLKSGESSSLNFTWQGINYHYGPDQHVQLATDG
jgi:hypothetical protein